jgi:N-acetylglucosaminyldiphosphoundecaprenol N-acetyl-beta-D-mannosaminyltransferase
MAQPQSEVTSRWQWEALVPAWDLEAAVRMLQQQLGPTLPGAHILTLNLDIWRQLVYRPKGNAALLQSSYTRIFADGAPILWFLKIIGHSGAHRVTGADLLPRLTRATLTAGFRVHLSGGPAGVAAQVASSYQHLATESHQITHSAFNVSVTSEQDALRAADSIASARPDLVFLAYGFPKQDLIAIKLRESVPNCLVIGCGAALAFNHGTVKRAPSWVQQSHLEWLYRLAQEPRRLLSRYLVHDLPALPFLMRDATLMRYKRPGTKYGSS